MIPKPKHRSRAARRVAWVKQFKAVCLYVWETRPHSCEVCGYYLGEEARVHYFDHIKKRSQGGDNSPENIMLVCNICHSAKHGRREHCQI